MNNDFLKTWSHDMSYVLGLYKAKGCNNILTLPAKDKYILKKVAFLLDYQLDRGANQIIFGVNDMVTLDISKVPEEYLPDFIRGYFDGDGSVMLLKNNRLNSAFTSGSKDFLDSLLQILRDKAGVEGGSYDPHSKSIRFGKRDTIRIGKYIYNDNPSLYLLRKRDKFDLFI